MAKMRPKMGKMRHTFESRIPECKFPHCRPDGDDDDDDNYDDEDDGSDDDEYGYST